MIFFVGKRGSVKLIVEKGISTKIAYTLKR
jgi:hypothetical protein